MTSDQNSIDALIGKEVVLDVASQYVYVGRMDGYDDKYLILVDADVHDLRDTHTNRELYVVESRRHGVRANRKRVLVQAREVVSMSLLSDVFD